MKKTWKWFKIVLLLMHGVAVILGVLFLGFMIWWTMGNGQALENSRIVNYLSLGIGLFSLPGILVQLLSIWELNTKKKFIITAPCPNCRHTVEWTMKEK